MTTPKVDFRQLIRDGKITDDRAGQLIALDNYEGDILTDSEESTLRRGAKNTSILSDYIKGSNRLLRMEPNFLAAITEIDRDINYISWALSALKHTAVVKYAEPAVLIVTEEKYKNIPKEKYQNRVVRIYNLATLYRALVEDIIFNRRSQHKELVEKLNKDAKDGKEGVFGNENLVYGMDLIHSAGEIYQGWTPYNSHADYTLADLAIDLPELHSLVMGELRSLYDAKKISVDPDNVKLEKYKDTKITGKELSELDIKRLKDWFWAVEGRDSELDDYGYNSELSDEPIKINMYGEDAITSEQESAIIATKYQKYAILQNPRENEVKDGRYKLDFMWEMEAGPFFGYSQDKETNIGEVLISRIKGCRESIILNAKLLTMFSAYRLKAGKLLHIDKADGFIYRTENMFNLDERYRQYEAWRNIYQLDDIQAQISDPKAIKYLKRVQEVATPLYDQKSLETTEVKMAETRLQVLKAHHPTPEMTHEWLTSDPHVKQGLELIEGMELSGIERVSDRLLDLLREAVKEDGNERFQW